MKQTSKLRKPTPPSGPDGNNKKTKGRAPDQQPKGATPRDRFMSSEVAAEAGTQKTSG